MNKIDARINDLNARVDNSIAIYGIRRFKQCQASFGGGENPTQCANEAEPESGLCASCEKLAEEWRS